jgi:hypothetical protein
LYFLQSIDEVGYSLMEKGNFGKSMEIWCDVVKQVEVPRRVNDKWLNLVDTLLFFGTVFILLAAYGYAVFHSYSHSDSS